jgi:hypothetical protein
MSSWIVWRRTAESNTTDFIQLIKNEIRQRTKYLFMIKNKIADLTESNLA